MHNDLKQKIEESYNSAYRLIGLTEYSESEFCEMLEYVKPIVPIFKCDIPQNDRKIVFAALVEMAKHRADTYEESIEESGLWDYIFSFWDSSLAIESGTRYLTLTNMIDRMCRDGVIPGVYTGQRYYATIMMHALVPKRNLLSFFDLCFKVYSNDFDYGFAQEDMISCTAIADSLKSFLTKGYSEKESVHIGSGAYNIKIGLRSFALCENNRQQFIEFINNVFDGVNTLFYREKFIPETRVDDYLLGWWQIKSELDKSTQQSEATLDRLPITTKQNVSIKYILRNKQVYLCIPPIRLDDSESNVSLKIKIGKHRVTFPIPTKRGELLTTSVQFEKKLDELLNDYRVDENVCKISIDAQVICDDEILFNSTSHKKTSLNREFILFSEGKEEQGKIKQTTNYFVYVRDADTVTFPEYAEYVWGNLYSIRPKNGEVLQTDTESVLFVDKMPQSSQDNTICLVGNYANALWILDEYKCDIYPRKVVLIVSPDYNLKSLELRIDNNSKDSKKLSVISYTQDYETGLLLFDLTYLFKPVMPFEVIVHSYEKDRHLVNAKIIAVPDFDIEFSRPFYYGNLPRKVVLTYNKECHELTWDDCALNVVFDYEDADVFIDIPYFKWRINDSEWQYAPVRQKKWHNDYVQNGDVLEIDTTHIPTHCSIMLSNEIEDTPYNLKQKHGRYEVGRAICALENYKTITAYAQTDEGERLNLFEVATEEQFIDCPVKYENNTFYWSPVDTYIGRYDTHFFLIIKGKGINIRREMIMQDGIIVENVQEGKYRITVKTNNANIFSKKDKIWNTIYEQDILVGDFIEDTFARKRMVLSRAYISKGYNFRFQKKYIIDQLIPLEEENTYKGRLCELTITNKVMPLDSLRNLKGEQETINPVKVTILPDKKLELAAGLVDDIPEIGPLFCDLIHKEICNIEKENLYYSLIDHYQYKLEDNV